MNIWIVNYYTGTPETVSNPRYVQLAKNFMASGHRVLTFNSATSARISEAELSGHDFVQRDYGDHKFVHVKVMPYQGNGARRMLSIWKFARTVLKIRKYFEKPDVILHNIHPPFDYPIVRLAKKLKAKYIAEAWDLWPADFVTFGLVKENHPALKIAYQIEKKYYEKADEVIFTFEGGIDYLKKKGWTTENGGKINLKNVHYVNNGIDIAEFDKNTLLYPRPDADMNDPNLKKIVYLGSISRANNVQTLIDAAKLLQKDERYRFFIYGDGTFRDDLEQYVIDQHIDNVVFKEKSIPLAECAWVVSQATVNVMNYQKNFGWMGVSSGKMFQYLAAGKPIVCNIGIAYDDVISNNHLGIARDLETPGDFVEAIKAIAEQPEADYQAMCQRTRQTAKQFDYQYLSKKELSIICK